MSPPPADSPSASLGVIVISTFVALITYGLSLDQTYRYFSCYTKDALNLKLVIIALFLVNTLHAICVMQIWYAIAFIYWRDPMVELFYSWSGVTMSAEGHYTTDAVLGLPYFWLLPITTTATCVIVHYFFVRRVYMISGRSRLFYVITGSALVVAFALCVASAVTTFKKRQITYNPMIILTISELSILIALNLFVNAKLVYHLHNAKTGVASTNSMINRIIRFSIHTGTISSILGLASIILLSVSPGVCFLPLIQMLAGFEGNAVLFAVNSRRSMVDHGSSGIEIQGVDLDVPQERRLSAITWATGAGATDTVATIELGALPRGSSPSPRAETEEPKVGRLYNC